MENLEQDLCTSCGLCCDGTIFPYMNIREDEVHLFNQLHVHVDQRCQHLSSCNSCKIYKKRPYVCKIYKCEVLKAFENTKITFEEAQKLIKVVKSDKTNKNKIRGIIGDLDYLQECVKLKPL